MKRIITIVLSLFINTFIMNAQDWGEQILNQPNQIEQSLFGFSVDIDGDYAIIGASAENKIGSHGEVNRYGSAHIYKKDVNGTWNHHQKLESFVGNPAGDMFGYSVAIQGDFVYVGAINDRYDDISNPNDYDGLVGVGSVMIFKKDENDVWNGIQRIRSDVKEANDNFGYDISVDGDYLLVGAPGYTVRASIFDVNNYGTAYIFKKDVNDVYTQVQQLATSHRANSDRIGKSLSISGDYIVLASKNSTDENNANNISGNGSAFVFKKGVDDVWVEVQKLKPNDGVSNSYFGFGDVTISGNYIAVGANNLDKYDNETNAWNYGHVYLFKKDENDVWNESQVLKTPYPASNFGSGVSLDNNLLLISAPKSNVEDNGSTISNVGLSYLYIKNADEEFVLKKTIQASQVDANSTIGEVEFNGNPTTSSIAINGNHFIIGAPNIDLLDQNPIVYNVGSAFISGNINTFLGQTITWSGAESNDWNTPGNWDANIVPAKLDDVILADVANAPSINFNETHSVKNLTNQETLTIKKNASLTILENLDQRDSIIIWSSADGNGSFILKGNQINENPPNLTYFRYVEGDSWHLVSNPVKNQDIDVFAAATPLAEGQVNVNNRGLAYYNKDGIQGWSYYQTGTNDSGDFISGKGYGINITAKDSFLRFEGAIKDDNLSNYAITDNFNQWNLVGNPYPAFINLNVSADATNNFLTENSNQLDPEFANIYLWNSITNSYDPIGNGLGAKYIAPGQGFFIRAKNGGGTIDINKTMLTHQTGNLFLKDTQQPQKIVLQIKDNTTISETIIAFKKGMTKGLDVTYDAGVFSGESKNLSIYTHLLEANKNVPFAIQFLPELEDNDFIIPLGISQNGEQEITLSLKESSLYTDKKIYLEDKIENTFTELNNNTDYTFSLQNQTSETGRFFLHFQQKSLNVTTIDASSINTFVDKNNKLHIKGGLNGFLNIYSITGKNIISNYKLKNQSEKVDLQKLSKGVYLINIKIKERSFTKKIIF